MELQKLFKYLRFVGVALGIIVVILMAATPVLVINAGPLTLSYKGTYALFGGDGFKASHISTLAFIWTILIAIAIPVWEVLIRFVFPTINYDMSERRKGLPLMLWGVGLIIAAIFIFASKAAFISANGGGSDDGGLQLGVGWIIAGILELLAGLAVGASGAVEVF